MTLSEEINLKVFIGWDSKQVDAYKVCEHSIRSRSDSSISITPLIQSALREQGLYTREKDSKASTEFSLTRFLVPFLSEYSGWSVFCDCDFLWQCDITELLSLANPEYAVQVVQHEYTPKSSIKMANQQQHFYPRKNWSSMVLWNCAHPSHKKLSLKTIHNAQPSYLHRFAWLKDCEIGSLPVEWNSLSGYYPLKDAKAIHYTDGGPWLKEHKDCDGGNLWRKEFERLK